MCEGCRVKMGYVTYGGKGGRHKNAQVERAVLKNREKRNMSRETGGEQKKKYIREKAYQKRHSEGACVHVCVCSVLYNMAMCALAKWNLSTTSEIH